MNVASLRPKSSTEDPVEDMEEGECALIRVPHLILYVHAWWVVGVLSKYVSNAETVLAVLATLSVQHQ